MNFFVERIQTKIGNNSGTEIDPKITPLFPGIEVKIKDINDTDFMLSHIRLECTTIKKDSYIMHKLEGKYNVSYVILYGSYWPLDASVRIIQPTSYTHRQTHTHTRTHTQTHKDTKNTHKHTPEGNNEMIQVKADSNECTSGGTIPTADIPYYVFYCNSSQSVASVTVTATSTMGLCEIEAYGEEPNF